jgi:hypothetical protein
MSGRKPLLENDEPLVRSALAEFPLRDQALITLGPIPVSISLNFCL